MSNANLNIGITIGKQDLDIAAWYNMLKENNLSIVAWTNNVVLAYLSDKPLDIGTIHIKTKEENPQSSNFMFGSGNSQSNQASKFPKERWEQKTRGKDDELIEGSVLFIRTRNEDVIYALKSLKSKGYTYSGTIKALIRRYLKTGKSSIPPLYQSFNSLVSLEYLDKGELRKKREKDEKPNSMKKNSNRNQQKQVEQKQIENQSKEQYAEQHELDQYEQTQYQNEQEHKPQTPQKSFSSQQSQQQSKQQQQSQQQPKQQQQVKQQSPPQQFKQQSSHQQSPREKQGSQGKNPLLNFIS